MSSFKHLRMPEEDKFHDHNISKWFVLSEDFTSVLQVRDGKLVSGIAFHDGPRFGFESRLAAFEASVHYYSIHSTFYPHEVEWLKEDAGGVTEIANNAIESQVMRFE